MKKYTFTGKLIDYKRLNCSVYGNPAYYGWFENDAGETLSGRTKTDASCGYSFLNKKDSPRELTYHVTRTGNVIIDYIKVLEVLTS